MSVLCVWCSFLDSVPAVAVEYFRDAARKLIKQRGALESLAAALAHISGATNLKQRSLMNSDTVRHLSSNFHSTSCFSVRFHFTYRIQFKMFIKH